MKKLDFNPLKSGSDFRKNYKLHDLAEYFGTNLLHQWGIKTFRYGEDKRYQRVWEKGEDKPDLIISYKDKSALLDWKGKHKPLWLVNARAVDSYKIWSKELNIPVIIAFFVFSQEGELIERRFAFLNKHSYINSANKQWDKNETIEFNKNLPVFNRANLINALFDN
ncbi:MAG: hypothetical protein KJ799_11705 [Bacteroidetes bacterium]|nr:hypothetical protein [Bacteroidota bacterium]MBU1678797.1 hypothetical protein [Bacteroidota bacterium]MBU2507370.1 hypothetical protein [Bacteroidota bacterium]